MAKTLNSHTVIYERDEAGWWVASVHGVPGCHTQGRSLTETRRRIREALELFVPHADGAILIDRVRLPAALRGRVRQYAASRRQAETAQFRSSALAKETAKALQKSLRLSLRDAGTLLGLSFQRVQQLRRRAKRG